MFSPLPSADILPLSRCDLEVHLSEIKIGFVDMEDQGVFLKLAYNSRSSIFDIS